MQVIVRLFCLHKVVFNACHTGLTNSNTHRRGDRLGGPRRPPQQASAPRKGPRCARVRTLRLLMQRWKPFSRGFSSRMLGHVVLVLIATACKMVKCPFGFMSVSLLAKIKTRVLRSDRSPCVFRSFSCFPSSLPPPKPLLFQCGVINAAFRLVLIL